MYSKFWNKISEHVVLATAPAGWCGTILVHKNRKNITVLLLLTSLMLLISLDITTTDENCKKKRTLSFHFEKIWGISIWTKCKTSWLKLHSHSYVIDTQIHAHHNNKLLTLIYKAKKVFNYQVFFNLTNFLSYDYICLNIKHL